VSGEVGPSTLWWQTDSAACGSRHLGTDAEDTEGLLAAFVDQRVDRIHPWPGDRPWKFVLHDGRSRRVDLHLYETLGDRRLHNGSVNAPFLFTRDDLPCSATTSVFDRLRATASGILASARS